MVLWAWVGDGDDVNIPFCLMLASVQDVSDG